MNNLKPGDRALVIRGPEWITWRKTLARWVGRIVVITGEPEHAPKGGNLDAKDYMKAYPVESNGAREWFIPDCLEKIEPMREEVGSWDTCQVWKPRELEVSP